MSCCLAFLSSLSVCLIDSRPVCLCLFLCLFISLFLSLFLSLCLSLSIWLSLSDCLFLCLMLCLRISVYFFLSTEVCLSVYMSFYPVFRFSVFVGVAYNLCVSDLSRNYILMSLLLFSYVFLSAFVFRPVLAAVRLTTSRG